MSFPHVTVRHHKDLKAVASFQVQKLRLVPSIRMLRQVSSRSNDNTIVFNGTFTTLPSHTRRYVNNGTVFFNNVWILSGGVF